jgi:GTP-binding protein HflX
VVADTVGFVRDLPHELIAAFESTLEETRESRLLLHVIDAADAAHHERIERVAKVLTAIGAGHLPVIQVYNKVDMIGVEPRLDRSETGLPWRVWLSAATGAGIDVLLSSIAEYLHRDVVRGTIRLAVSQARLRALLYQRAGVRNERILDDGGWEIELAMDRAEFLDLQRLEDIHIQVPPNQLVAAPVMTQ